MIAPAALAAAQQLNRTRRQLAHHDRAIAKCVRRSTPKLSAHRGLHDAECRQYLRGMPEAERNRMILTNPSARGAALRGDEGLAGNVHPQVMAEATEAAIRENAATEAAALVEFEKAHEIYESAMRLLAFESFQTARVVDGNSVRPFMSQVECEHFLAGLPVPPANVLAIGERAADQLAA